MELLKYLLISTVIFSVSYTVYLLMFKNAGNFIFQRFLLLSIVLLALLLPLSDHRIVPDFYKSEKKEAPKIMITNSIKHDIVLEDHNIIQMDKQLSLKQLIINNLRVFGLGYFFVSLILLLRMMIGLSGIFRLYLFSIKNRQGNYILIYHNKSYTFSFFNCIFVPHINVGAENFDNILMHEKTHSDQFHSIDVLICEILSCFFWFNPLVWHFKSHIKLIHEYLADENVLRNGIDVKEYQTGLLSQIEEYQQLKLGSNYFFSIKKRIIMMTKIRNQKIGTLRYLSLVLLFATSFLFVGYINGQEKPKKETTSSKTSMFIQKSENHQDTIKPKKVHSNKNIKASDNTKVKDFKDQSTDQQSQKPQIIAMELPKMNVLFIGIDNPLKIAVSGIDNSELDVSIDNGQITGKNGEYSIFVTKPGSAIVTVSHKGKILQQTEFKVKRIPDPFSTSNEDYKTYSGKISKDEILRWGTIEFLYKYFGLQLNAQMVFYRMVVAPADEDPTMFMRNQKSFDEMQLGFIKKLKPGDKLHFEDIIVIDELYNPRKVGAATIIIE